MIAGIVYFLCALTSVICAVLLLRGYRKTRAKITFWSSLCFICLAVNNVLLFLDLRVISSVSLIMGRDISALAGVMLMLYGLIWDNQ